MRFVCRYNLTIKGVAGFRADVEHCMQARMDIHKPPRAHFSVFDLYTESSFRGLYVDISQPLQNARLLHDLLSAANIPVTLNPLSR